MSDSRRFDSPVASQAALTDGHGDFTVDEVLVRAPRAGEVRVRLEAAGICHTDFASLSWGTKLVLGHEGAGIVESVGDSVSSVRPGQPVLLNWAIPCGKCPQCLRQLGSLCERTLGVPAGRTDSSAPADPHTSWRGESVGRSFHLGTFSEYTLVRAEALTPLPPEIPMHSACILGCGVMTGVGSVINVAAVRPTDSVIVVGCGGVGLSAIQGARIARARRIVAVDLREPALERATAMGATHTIRASDDDRGHERLIAAALELTDGRGADYAFEASGAATLAFLPLRLVRNGGMALQISGSHGPQSVTLPWFMWNKRYVTPLYGGCEPRRDFPRLFDWVKKGALELDALISRTYRLGQLAEGFDDMLAGRISKGVIAFA